MLTTNLTLTQVVNHVHLLGKETIGESVSLDHIRQVAT